MYIKQALGGYMDSNIKENWAKAEVARWYVRK